MTLDSWIAIIKKQYDSNNEAMRVNVVAGGGSGGTSAADQSAFSIGSGTGTPAMGLYESSPSSVGDGQVGTLGMTISRELKVSIENDNVGIGGGTQYAEGDVLSSATGNVMMGRSASGLARAVEFTNDGLLKIAIQEDNVGIGGGGSSSISAKYYPTNWTLTSNASGVSSELRTNSTGRLLTVVEGSLPPGSNNIGYVNVASIQAGDNNIGNVDIVTLPFRYYPSLISNASGTQVANLSTDVLGRIWTNTVVTGSVDTELPAAVTLSDALSNPTTPLVGSTHLLWNSSNWVRAGIMSNGDGDGAGLSAQLVASTMRVFNGSTWDRARGDTTNGIDVDVTRLPINYYPSYQSNASGATTGLVTDVNKNLLVSLATRLDPNNDKVAVAHTAWSHGSNPSNASHASKVDAIANVHGIPFMIGGHPNVVTKEWEFTDAMGSQSNLALVNISSGSKIIITQLMVTAHNANTTQVDVRIGFGNTTLASMATGGANKIVFSHPGIPAGGGAVRGDGSGIVGVGSDADDLLLYNSDPIGGSIRIVASYYTIPS